MYGINFKVQVSMLTEVNTAMVWNAYHAPEICSLHSSANFEKSVTQILLFDKIDDFPKFSASVN